MVRNLNQRFSKYGGLFLVAVGLFFLTQPVYAISWNFDDLADAPPTPAGTINGLFNNLGGEQGVMNVNNGFSWEQNGVTLTATAFDVINVPPAQPHPMNGGVLELVDSNGDPVMISPYLDSGNAGLGVCSLLDGTQCKDSADDNVTMDELLKLNFSEVVQIDQIDFKDAGHGTTFGDSTFFVRVDNGNWQQFGLSAQFNTPLTGKMFEFTPETNFLDKDNNIILQNDKNQFYINVVSATAVPIPSTLLFFGVGFAGFAAWRHREKLSKT